MNRFYALGGEHFLAFELGGVVGDLADAAGRRGPQAEADALDRTAAPAGRALPRRTGPSCRPHEVNYEQSMVAPLLDLLLAAHRLAPDRVPADELRRRLPWLTAFAADQPDVRMRAHADPALGRLLVRRGSGCGATCSRTTGRSSVPASSSPGRTGCCRPPRPPRCGGQGTHILRGNLTAFGPDGSATCAFVYPSCVNGQPAHVADPLANDQDWALGLRPASRPRSSAVGCRHGAGGGDRGDRAHRQLSGAPAGPGRPRGRRGQPRRARAVPRGAGVAVGGTGDAPTGPPRTRPGRSAAGSPASGRTWSST